MRYWLVIVFFFFIVHVANAEENLVGYWKFESINSTNYTLDYSGYGNDGKLINFSTNPPTTVAGRIGNALQFDGVRSYVDCGNNSILNFGSGSFTVEILLKTYSTMTIIPIIRKDTNINGPRWAISLNSSGFVSAFIGDESANGTITSSVSVNDNSWHYIAVVFSRNQNASMFVDGMISGNTIDISTLGSISNGENLLIGRLGTSDIFFNGTIDEVKIWNRTLTAMEIFENYFGKRTNPIVLPDVSEVSGNLNQNYTFNITVTNMDNQSYGDSVFKLISDCPREWNCSITPENRTIPPGNSSSYNFTIKPFIVNEEKTTVDVTVINMNNTRYNTTVRVGFILGSKCDKASIRISDVYFYTNTSANVTLENTGNSSLIIKSAVITDKAGKTYSPDRIPTGFDSGKNVYIIYTNISSCENFSKIVISTDCPTVSATHTEARCQVKPALVKIKSVRYEGDTVKIELRNDGSGAINSSSIKLMIDDRSVACKQNFQLLPKGIENCNIDGFICTDTTARMKIVYPNNDEKEFECLAPVMLTARTCIDSSCSELSATFARGKKIYFDVDTSPGANIAAVVSSSSGEERLIDITQPFKPKEAGDYTITVTASMEGYQDAVSKIKFTVTEGDGFPIKIVFIGLGVVALTGLVVFYINYRKNKRFEKLYQKYGKS